MIYVCGDSFGSSDDRSDIVPWHAHFECINFARNCATNLDISKQVDRAIAEDATFIILLCTTCVRFDWRGTFYSFHNLDASPAVFNENQKQLLKNYFIEFFELDLEIYKNKCIIESVLQRLVDSELPFLFDQGGFEHTKFGATQEYFKAWNFYRSKYNLWDHGDSKLHRPYFHITDQLIHNRVAEYYREQT